MVYPGSNLKLDRLSGAMEILEKTKAKKYRSSLYLWYMTPMEIIIKKLRVIKPELVSRFYVNSIGLFGSIVREDFSSSNSDVDIIVDFSKPVGIEFIDLAEYLEKHIDRKVDLISQKGIKQKYFDRIREDIIYV